MNKNTYSIIIPYYNAKKFINDCFFDISQQTLLPEKIILVDDGSSEEQKFSMDLVDKDLLMNVKFNVIYNDINVGPEKVLKKLIPQIETKFFKICAMDDRLSKDFAKKSINLLLNYPESSYVFSRSSMLLKKNNKFKKLNSNLKNGFYSGKEFEFLLKNKIFKVYSNTVVYNTSIFKKNNIFFEDFGVWSDWLNHIYLGVNYGVCFLDMHLAYYTIHDKQYNKSINKQKQYVTKIYEIFYKNKKLYNILINCDLLYDLSPLTIYNFKKTQLKEIYNKKLIIRSFKFFIWSKIKFIMPQNILNLLIKIFN